MRIDAGMFVTIFLALLLAQLTIDWLRKKGITIPAAPSSSYADLGPPPKPQTVTEWVTLYKIQHPECQ